MRVVLGCSGWAYDEWKGSFYAPGTEPKDYLRAYAKAFSFVEVDSSFYRPPTPEQASRWASSTPEAFRFSAKLPRAITHDAKLRGAERAVDAFLEALGPARRKLVAVLAQMGPGFRRDVDERALAEFVEAWPRSVPLVVELRHASWWVPETYALLARHGATLCWSLNETGRTPPEVTTPGFVYARLIGDRALDAHGGKWDRILRDMTPEARRLKEELDMRKPELAYVVINNHFMGHAPLSSQLVARELGVEPPNIARASRAEKQRGLGDFG